MTEGLLIKRAEEYGHEWGTPTDDSYACCRQGFIDGYHECQKEHEWHYVKDGDLPPLDTKVLCWEKCGSTFPVVAKRHIFKEWGKTEWEWECYWGSGYELPQNSVYAWKEIVPPKESE